MRRWFIALAVAAGGCSGTGSGGDGGADGVQGDVLRDGPDAGDARSEQPGGDGTGGDGKSGDASDAKPADPGAPDPAIAGAVGKVSADEMFKTLEDLVGFKTRDACSSPDETGSEGVGAARAYIKKRFEAAGGGRLVVSYNVVPGATSVCGGSAAEMKNVVAILPGRTGRRVMLVGHFDSQAGDVGDAPGANDSGSQTAALIEAARVMSPLSLDATVVFIALDGEEKGQLGSRHDAQALRKAGVDVTAVLVLDVVGGDKDTNTGDDLGRVRAFTPGTPRERGGDSDGTPDDTSPSRGLLRFLDSAVRRYLTAFSVQPSLREDLAGGGSTDNGPYLDESYASLWLCEPNPNLDRLHRSGADGDQVAWLTPSYLAQVTRSSVAFAASAAAAPAPPTGFSAKRVMGGVEVSFSAPSPAPVAYRVAARPVDEDYYRKPVTVPSPAAGKTGAATVTAASLGVAGTDFFVSIAAADAAGHESPHAYPEYRCGFSMCEVQPGSLDVEK